MMKPFSLIVFVILTIGAMGCSYDTFQKPKDDKSNEDVKNLVETNMSDSWVHC